MQQSHSPRAPITIKKYANRRLYNTATSSYVTLDNLAAMVKAGVDFTVFDAKTGEDITRSVLTQIIVEEEAKEGQTLLPIAFLRQLIALYGDSLAGFLPRYLEASMQAFLRSEPEMRQIMQGAIGGLRAFPSIEEMGRYNMAILDSVMKMVAPFAPAPPADAPAPAEADAEDLRARIDRLQRQIDELSKRA